MDSLPTPSDSASDSDAAAAEWPLPREGVAVTHLLIVRDVARLRRFYADVLGARVLMEGPPAILRFYNSWLVLSMEGGPTDDKLNVVAVAPPDSRTLTSALNLRVADIRDVYERWRARGAEFLTPPKEHAAEIRFTIDEAVCAAHQQVGADLPAYNGDESWELPMAGTFLIDHAGIVRLAFVDPDFMHRLDPSAIITRLQELQELQGERANGLLHGSAPHLAR